MISLRKYNEYWQAMVKATQGRGIERPLQMAAMVTNEAKLKDIINKPDTRYPLLVSIVPGATFGGRDIDNIKHSVAGMIFVLEKVGQSNKTPQQTIDLLAVLEELMNTIIEEMLLDYKSCSRPGHEVMKKLNLATMNLEPEENYLGCDGWSLGFRIDIDF
jgi:hypothetical protein